MKSVFIIFLHKSYLVHVVVLLHAIYIVLGRWGALRSEDLDLEDRSREVQLCSHLTQGHICLLCFHSKYCNRLSISIFVFWSMGRVKYSCVLRWWDWDLVFPITFIWKRFWRLYYVLWKILISHYFSLCICNEWYERGLSKNSESSTTSCHNLRLCPNF